MAVRRRVSRRTFVGAASYAAVFAALGGGHPAGAVRPTHPRWRMPEESRLHARAFMQWPVNRTVYPDGEFLSELKQTIADLANTIASFEPVVMLMDQRFARTARRQLSAAVDIWDVPTDDLWCRDSGPVFVMDRQGGMAVSHLNFNGWGGKQDHRRDAQVARLVADRLELPLLDNGLVGEAGGVEFDGEGTLIAHESSWVNPNRNP